MSLISGKSFIIAGEEYIVPALTLRSVKNIRNRAKEMSKQMEGKVKELQKRKQDLDKKWTETEDESAKDLIDAELNSIDEQIEANVEKSEELVNDLRAEIAVEALKRNYPHVDVDFVMDNVNTATLIQIQSWAMVGDLEIKQQGKE